MKKYMNSPFSRYNAVWIFVILFVAFSIYNSNFATVRNVNVWAVGRVTVGFFALAAMLPLIAGEFDISLGYMLGTSIMIGGWTATNLGFNSAMVLITVVLTATMLGCFNGLLSVVLKIPSTISTLGSGMVFYGITLWTNDCKSFSTCLANGVVKFAKTKLLGINVMVYILIVVAICLYYVLERTPFGKHIYAVGLSERVAHLAGIRTKFVRFLSFAIAGMLIGIGAALFMCTSGNAMPDTGPSYLMPGLATVFLSITTHKIGRYNTVGTVVAIFLLGMVFNGLNIVGTPFWFEGVVNGIILLGVVLFNGAESRQAAVG
jgi:ribose transport system permease protein